MAEGEKRTKALQWHFSNIVLIYALVREMETTGELFLTLE